MKTSEIKNSIAHTRLRQIWGILYICAVMAGLSFYFADGYVNIGEDKYRVFMHISCIGAPVWVLLRAAGLAGDMLKRKKQGSGAWKYLALCIDSIAAGEWFVIFYGIGIVVTTLTSNYRSYALWGCNGWHMGMVVQLLMIVLYFAARDVFGHVSESGRRILTALLLGMAGAVFLLGILNRFSIYPFRMTGQEEDFISTLGNINWYCGYWCIWYGLACGMFLRAETRKTRIIYALYVWIGSIAGVSCGATSAYLAWAAIGFAGFLICLSHTEKIIRWAQMELLAFLALPALRIIGRLRLYRMWYDSEWLKGVCYGNVWIRPFLCGILICLLLILFCRKRPGDYRFLRGPVTGAAIGAVLAVIVMIILNTVIEGGIWPVRGNGLFTWNKDWGNSRGGIWSTVILMIGDMDPYTMIFGAGCDCFYPYAYFTSSLSWRFLRVVMTQYLTNAHNIFLTMFVNQGIFGTVVYLGMIISHVKAGAACADSSRYTLGAVLAVGAYLAVGITGFEHILATPFFMLMLGMIAGEAHRERAVLDK